MYLLSLFQIFTIIADHSRMTVGAKGIWFCYLGDDYMKLSMWMIANRLSSFDMDISIHNEAKPCLYSARLAYATNCVYIHEGADGIICENDGSRILLRNMDITQAFEIIQGVFDFYEDWFEETTNMAKENDFQGVIDGCHSVLNNPVVLLDGNCKLLGMSKGYPLEEMDKEWQHLSRYGCSSLGAIQAFKLDYSGVDFQHHGEQVFYKKSHSVIGLSGISYCLNYGGVNCGRITVLEKDRGINPGDLQIVQILDRILEPELNCTLSSQQSRINNCFFNLLFGKYYDETDLELQLKYNNWKKDDSFQVTAIYLGKEFFEENDISLNLFFHMLQNGISDCVILRNKSFLYILSHIDLTKSQGFMEILGGAPKSVSLKIGHSLFAPDITRCGALLSQAKAAIEYGEIFEPEKEIYNFMDYAVDFMFHNTSFSERVASCHPAIVSLFEAKVKYKDDLFDTLKYYLDYDRSVSKTAALMYAHKNTVIYRIKKIKSMINEDFDEPRVRNYLRASINVMELSEKVGAFS